MSPYRYRSPSLPRGVPLKVVGWLGPDKQREVVQTYVEEHFDPRGPEHLLFDERDEQDVYEEVIDEFDGVIPAETVEDIVAEMMSDRQWVRRSTPRRVEFEYPTNRLSELVATHRLHQPQRLGSARELQERAALEDAVQVLSRHLKEMEAQLGLRGHNGGPIDESTVQGQFLRVQKEAGKIARQLSSKSINPKDVAESALAIEHIAKRQHWFDQDLAAEEYSKAFGRTLGEEHAKAVNKLGYMFVIFIFVLLKCAIEWLGVVAT